MVFTKTQYKEQKAILTVQIVSTRKYTLTAHILDRLLWAHSTKELMPVICTGPKKLILRFSFSFLKSMSSSQHVFEWEQGKGTNTWHYTGVKYCWLAKVMIEPWEVWAFCFYKGALQLRSIIGGNLEESEGTPSSLQFPHDGGQRGRCDLLSGHQWRDPRQWLEVVSGEV